jgi:Ca2+-transporting ATPase
MKFSFPGLSDTEVATSRQQYGSNAVSQQASESFWEKLMGNIKDPIIIILIVALMVTVTLAVFGYAQWYEGMGIACAVALATLVATWSEYSNENEFQRLLAEASMIQVKVFRNTHLIEIGINELVSGDHILLQPGDTIPADGLLIAGHLDVSQAALTGESEAIRKTPPGDENSSEDDATTLFRASLVEDGEAVMRINAVGDQTEYGKTLKEVLGAQDRLSPLQEKLTVLGGHISTFGYVGASFIFFAFMYKHAFMDAASFGAYMALPAGEIIAHLVTALTLAIIIIVVAVPEGLPMMIAIVLSLNMRKLLHAKVLVRKLLGIETAGSLTVLFSDKTGTLTQGRLVMEKFLSGEHQQYGKFDDIPDKLRAMLTFALRNNTSAVLDTDNPADIKIVGADRTEQALLRFLGSQLAEKSAVDIVEMISFSSARKFSAMQVSGEHDLTLVKGAPEILLENCTYYLNAGGDKVDFTDKASFLQEMHALSTDAMRLIAVAITDHAIDAQQHLPVQLTLVGICGIRDGLRETSKPAVSTAHKAGIQVVMITGDAKETAAAIARDIGLLDGDDKVLLTSTELTCMSDDEVKAVLPQLAVVSRAYPTDKSRLVKLAKDMNWVVGMTGDGVNDAPAVKHADVGFAMGSGTEMTKQAADISILDDDFASITRAVLYGRTLFKSIRKFLIFQLTVNVSAILLAFLGPFMGFDLPLTMVQLLWVNLIMDTLAALAFSGEAALQRYMLEKPIAKNEALINKDMWSSIVLNGIVATMLSLAFLKADWVYTLFTRPHMEHLTRENNMVFLTAFFAFFVFLHNFNKFNARTDSLNLFDHILENKSFLFVVSLIFVVQIGFSYIGGEVLRTVGLSLTEWLTVIAMAAIIIPVDLARKLVRNICFGNPVLRER